jgi:hypothetical protein
MRAPAAARGRKRWRRSRGGIDVEMAEAKMLYGGGFVGRREKGTNDFARQEEGDPMAARGRTNRTDGHDYLDDVERVRG